MTPFSVLCGACGLSHREAAELLGVRRDTAKSWSSGRNQAPAGAIEELRVLAARIERAAAEALSVLMERRPDQVDLGYATDDVEARLLGWPCVGAQAAMLGRVVAGAPASISIRLVPRGSTVASAGAADAHDR